MQATEETIFNQAIEKHDASERSAYLKQACAGDSDLRKRVELLLSAYGVGEFLERPAVAIETMAPSAAIECPGTLIGPYKLLEQVGEGGMGLVYMAEQQRPVRRLVALKIIKPHRRRHRQRLIHSTARIIAVWNPFHRLQLASVANVEMSIRSTISAANDETVNAVKPTTGAVIEST
jgi:hypothetical protein